MKDPLTYKRLKISVINCFNQQVHHQKERIRYSGPMRIQPHRNNVRQGAPRSRFSRGTSNFL
ncbi:hypothetical protein Hanom_Chr14g01305271 [Helianthus anomalus]